MIVREAPISALSESEFIEVKELDLARDIWDKLEKSYKDDEYTKKVKF